MSRFISACLAVTLTAASAWGWNIPDPAKVEAPGAKLAPASDPRTYPDAAGFQQRSKLVIEGLATNDLANWRKGYFTGGDPGKYLPGPAMAMLLLNPNDPTARQYMNDDRSPKEHYHFAAVNWARFLPIFGEALTPETRKTLAASAATYTSYVAGQGTENHKVMWYTSGLVLPSYLEGGRIARLSAQQAVDKQKAWLRQYVKGLYMGGQGEWDSSTYLMFDVNGMLNIYDFGPDPECKLLAKAALDWYITSYALKYRDGVYCSPNQRGFATGAVEKIADQTGYIWWGSNKSLTAAQTRGFLYTIHSITSAYRPNKVITNLARKDLPTLPFEQRNSKPNYWGVAGEPNPSAYHESVYTTADATIGALWNGHGSQVTRFMIVGESPNGGVVLTGGNPRQSDHVGTKTGLGLHDGNGRYSQFAALGPVVVSMANCPADDTEANYSFVSLPDGNDGLKPVNGWWPIKVGKVVVGVRPLGGNAELGTGPADKKGHALPILKIPGNITGFVAVLADPAKFAQQLAAIKIDDAAFARSMRVTVTGPAGNLTMTFNPDRAGDAHGNRTPDVLINDKTVAFGNWPVFDGPYVQQKNGILSVNDGKDGFVVDFSGNAPIYKPWKR